jgi:hypothetical protein
MMFTAAVFHELAWCEKIPMSGVVGSLAASIPDVR